MPIRHAPWADAPPDFAIGLAPIDEADWLEGEEDEIDGIVECHHEACHFRIRNGDRLT